MTNWDVFTVIQMPTLMIVSHFSTALCWKRPFIGAPKLGRWLPYPLVNLVTVKFSFLFPYQKKHQSYHHAKQMTKMPDAI